MKKPAAAAAKAKTPSASPIPMPIFAPWLRPLLPLAGVPAVDVERVVGDTVDCVLVLSVVPVLADEELPVF